MSATGIKVISEVEYLKAVLKKRYGIDLSLYKSDFIRRRLYSRMLATHSKNVVAYVKLLDEKPEELNMLLDSLRINVSSFFRDPHIWPRIKEKVFRPLIERKARIGGTLRALSAGCSCGEEPYSMAIMIEELMEEMKLKVPYSIIGLDIDEEALLRAKNAIYDEKSLAHVPKKLVTKYFDSLGHGKVKVKESIKSRIRFIKMDLRTCNYPKGFDVVFCRNVLIYFSNEVKEMVIKALHQSMTSNAYLILGLTESIGGDLRHLFKLIDPVAKIYQKTSSIEC